MSNLEISSPVLENNADAAAAALLLANYSFDLSGYRSSELVERWLVHYPANWIRLAVIEALYQGRYKAISVEQILVIWLRRNQLLYHFKYEFERLICSKLPQELQDNFASRAERAEIWPEDDDRITNLSISSIYSPCCDRSSERSEVIPSSTPFEALLQTSQEEQWGNSSVAIAEITPSRPKLDETAIETKSALSESELSPLGSDAAGNYQSHQQVVDGKPETFVNFSFNHPPIDQFTPNPPSTDFHDKLKALVETLTPSGNTDEVTNAVTAERSI